MGYILIKSSYTLEYSVGRDRRDRIQRKFWSVDPETVLRELEELTGVECDLREELIAAMHEAKTRFRCPECRKCFQNSSNLTQHIFVHTGEKPYVCEYVGCKVVCSSSSDLVKHTRTHTGEKPFRCTYPGCIEAFAVASARVSHSRVHTGETPYACDFSGCDYASATSGALATHKRTHTGERPYKCIYDGCIHAAATSGALKVHMRKHSGEKPYKCSHTDCNFACSSSGDLAKHVRSMHSEEKRYKCTYAGCIKAFALSGTLRIHVRKHTGERPYKCSHGECGATFSQQAHLNKHVKAFHTPEGQARRKRKEEHIRKILRDVGLEFKSEHHIDTSCIGRTFVRIDIVLTSTVVILLEVDEFQHEEYACDVRRMGEVMAALTLEGNTLPVLFLRYNPDEFRVNGVKSKLKKKDREAKLLGYIKDVLSGAIALDRPVSVQYMFYDVDLEEGLEIWKNPDFDPVFRRDHCLPPII